MLTAAPLMAAPEGGSVAAGSATITQSGVKTDIHQSSNKAIIDWRSFDIRSGEHTQFHQPSSSSVTLNRINDVKASQIDGKLTANGHIMLINPNGVVFGSGAQVDVGSLTATSADIDNTKFMAGDYDFDKAGDANASIINDGLITAKEAGLVNLVAPRVENNGVIYAKMGKVRLTAAEKFTLDLAGDNLINIAVSDEDAAKIVQNTGNIDVEGGTVALTAAKARNIVDNMVINSGVITASSMTKKGGKIILGASNVKVAGTLKADGKTGGGEILVGGDYQGAGADTMPIAQNTIVTQDAVITANATDTGDGGKVIVWADQNTGFAGLIEANGGPNGGDGGLAEVSGKSYLDFRGYVSLLGDTLGELLLDPDDIDIVAGTANPGEFADDFVTFAENGGGTSTIGADTLAGRLSANANVTLQANNTIDVLSSVVSTGSGNLTLETAAGGTITVSAAIDVNTGALTLIADEIDISANLSGTGDIQLTSADVSQEIEIGSTDAGDLNLTATELGFLQNGWNSITIGGTDHEALISVNEAVSFADHTYLRNNAVNGTDRPIDINATISTTDNSDLYLYGSANASSVHGWSGVYITADMNIARDFYAESWSQFIALTNNITTGRNFTVDSRSVVTFNSDLDVGGDFLLTTNSPAVYDTTISNGHTLNVVGDITFDLTGDLKMETGSALEADGNISVTSNGMNLDSTSQIRSGSGTSNLTFLETGQDADMELGGTSHSATWQMSTAELDTIQEGFNSITFGSTSHLGGIIFSGNASFSDDVTFRQDQVNATGQINRDLIADNSPLINTTDGANASFYGANNSSWSRVDNDIAGNAIYDGFVDINLRSSTIGGDLTVNVVDDFFVHSSSNVFVNGNANITAADEFKIGASAASSFNVSGDINVESGRVNFFTGSTISDNGSGTSNLTFREYGEDNDMELGGSSHGATWEMSAAELSGIQNGFNSITFGSTAHTGGIIFSDNVSFSDDVIFRQDQVNSTGQINRDIANDVRPTFTTTDGANASFYGDQGYQWELTNYSIAGNLLFDGFGDISIATSNIGGDLTVNIKDDLFLHSGNSITVGGDVNFDAADSFTMGFSSASSLQANGDINISSDDISIFTGSTISGNADGSSNITFREFGENADMELGGTSNGSVWQMENTELAAIQDGFNKITFGSSTYTGEIHVTGTVDAGTNDLKLMADEIEISGNLSGTGDLQLTSADVNQQIEIGSTDAGDLNLTATELGFLQNGWNSITIGGDDHAASIAVNEAVSFADHTYLRNDISSSGFDHAIDVNAAITTTDNADLGLYGRATNTSVHPYDGVHITGSLNIARDLIVDSSFNDSYFGGGGITVGRHANLNVGNNTDINTDFTVGGDLSITHNTSVSTYDLEVWAGHTIDVTGDITVDFSDKGIFRMQAGSALESDGNITIRVEDNIDLNDANLTTTGGDIILNADRDADMDGAIDLNSTDIVTNGGNFTAGGGADPTTTAAYGNATFTDGVLLANASSVNTGAGNIILRGVADDQDSVQGVDVNGSSSLTTTTGNITIDGVAAATSESTFGINVSNASFTTADGTINLTGTNNSTTGDNNEGIRFQGAGASLITSTGTGDIILTGNTAGTSSSSQAVNLAGLGSNSINYNNGNVTITGTTASTTTVGVRMQGEFDLIGTGSGDLTINAFTGNLTQGFDASTGSEIGGSSATGDITINANAVNISNATSVETDGTITFAPHVLTTIGIGGGSGDLNLTDAELAIIDAGGKLIIGDSASGTGAVDIDSWDLTGTTYDVEVHGGATDIGGMTLGAGNVTVKSTGDVTINTAIGNSGAGGDAYLVAGNDFINTAGASAIDVGAGARYLVYAADPANITDGGLTADYLYNRTFSTDAPASISAAFGSRFVVVSAEPSTTTSDTNPVDSLTPTVQQQIDVPNIQPPFIPTVQTVTYTTTNSDGGKTETKQQVRFPNTRQNRSDHGSEDVGIRLITSDKVEVRQKIVEMFDLCSYDGRYCQ